MIGHQGTSRCPEGRWIHGCQAATAVPAPPSISTHALSHAHSHMHPGMLCTSRRNRTCCKVLQLPASSGAGEGLAGLQQTEYHSFTDDAETDKPTRATKGVARPANRQKGSGSLAQSHLLDQRAEGTGKADQPDHNTEVRIRVEHPSSIATTRAAHWALLQELVPKDEWKKTAVVLACLESIYRAEYLQYGQEALAALQRANSACVPAEDPLADISKGTALPAWLSELKPSRQQEGTIPSVSTGSITPVNKSSGAVAADGGGAYADGTSLPSSVQEAVDVTGVQPAPAVMEDVPDNGTALRGTTADISKVKTAAGKRDSQASDFGSNRDGYNSQDEESDNSNQVGAGSTNSHDNSSSSNGKGSSSDSMGELEPLQSLAPESLQETAAQLDAELASLVAILIQRSHFEPLTLRDVEVAKALNRDWLLQLFIVGDIRRCDKTLVQAVNSAAGTLAHTSPDSPVVAMDSSDTALMRMRAATSPGSFEWAHPLPDPDAPQGSTDSEVPQDTSGSNAPQHPAEPVLNPVGPNSSTVGSTVTGDGVSMQDKQQGVTGRPAPTHAAIHAFAESVKQDQEDGVSDGNKEKDDKQVALPAPDQLVSAATTAAAAAVSAASGYVARLTDGDSNTGSSGIQLPGVSDVRASRSGDDKAPPSGGVAATFRGISRHAGDGDGKTGATAVLKARRKPVPARSSAVSGISEAAWGTGVALPPESEGLLLYKRGYGEVQSTGRLVVQKLDYLQTLLVTLVLDGLRDGATSLSAKLLNNVAESLSSMAEEDDNSSSSNGSSAMKSQKTAHADQVPQPADTATPHDSDTQTKEPGKAQSRSPSCIEGKIKNSAAEQKEDSMMAEASVAVQAEAGSSDRLAGSTSDRLEASTSGRRTARRPPPLRRGWLVRYVQQSTSSFKQNISSLTRDMNLPKRALSAGRLAARWFSDRGVGPKLDVMTMRAIDASYPVQEPSRLQPLFLRKIALAEVFGPYPFKQKVGSLAKLLVQPVKLQQPTLKEFVVVYRKKQHHQPDKLLTVLQRIGSWLGVLPEPPEQPPQPRPPVHIRVYRDLPLPTWQLALPDKLLQFRPLDLLRADLFALFGLVALLAQAKYESLVLDIITLVSAGVFLVRIALGFKRMDDRYRNQVAEVLREKTVASDGPALEYLAAASALQQFKQVSLAYIFALRKQAQEQASSPTLPTSLGSQDDSFATADLPSHALGAPTPASTGTQQPSNGHKSVVDAAGNPPDRGTHAHSNGRQVQGGHRTERSQEGVDDGIAPVGSNGYGAACLPADCPGVGVEELAEGVERLLKHTCRQQVRFDAAEAVAELQRLGLAEVYIDDDGSSEQPQESSSIRMGPLASELVEGSNVQGVQYRVVSLACAMRLVQQHWDGLLWQRVDGILREFE